MESPQPLKKTALQARDRIILPLDCPSFKEAVPLITLLKDRVGLFKVGLTLFFQEGPPVLQGIAEIIGERRIFLDLKLYDTPFQVASAAAVLKTQAKALKFLTVHASGGKRVMQAVVEEMQGKVDILGVTALTSQGQKEAGPLKSLSDSRGNLESRVLALAKTAQNAGAAGVVASAFEAGLLKAQLHEEMLVVTPGIRPEWTRLEGDDQRRIMTPRAALQQGADYLVIGRPITMAKDPLLAVERIAEEMALSQ